MASWGRLSFQRMMPALYSALRSAGERRTTVVYCTSASASRAASVVRPAQCGEDLGVLGIGEEKPLQNGHRVLRTLGVPVGKSEVVIGLHEARVDLECRLELGDCLVVLPQLDIAFPRS